MTPAQPPPPTASNLPFQVSGSHTSNSIFESGDGLATAATRQCGGSCNGAGGGPPAPGAAGGVNGPAATGCAAVIVVFGSESDLRFSQAAGLESARTRANSIGSKPPGRRECTTVGIRHQGSGFRAGAGLGQGS